MAQEIEIEFKNLLTKEEFDYLLTKYPLPEKAQIQTNFYFDTKNCLLSEKESVLRIRSKNNSYRLTLKEPHHKGILETHDMLLKEEALAWINGNIIRKPYTSVQLKLLNIPQKDLHYYGKLKTERREVQLDDVLFVLDYSIYNGHSDFELELEALNKEDGLKKFESILKENNIPQRKTLSKVRRFFSTLS